MSTSIVRTAVAASSVCAALMMGGCSKQADQASTGNDAALQDLKAAIEESHAYDFQDGMQYGYTAAKTEDDVAAGREAGAITMFFYAGQRNGVHQLHQRNGNILTAIECVYPCDVMKVMMVIEGAGIAPNVQRFRIGQNAIANLALKDAAKGHLKQYGVDINGKQYTVWVDEQKGITRQRLEKPAP